MMKELTIIIPVYNRKGLVQRTLDSIPDTFNLIIIDNGSTDGSYEFCRQWMLNSRRQNVVIDREVTPGAAAARNKGLSLCKTKWVYFFDSDDLFTSIPGKWDESKDMICFPTVQLINKKPEVRSFKAVQTVYTHILNSMLNTISVIYKTEWLKSIGGWDNDCRVWDDWELGARALMHNPQLQWITDKAYHCITIHDESITGASFSDRYQEQLKTLRIVFDEVYDIENGKDKQRAFFALFLRCYILSGQLLKEKNSSASNEVEEFICDKFHVNKQSHRLGRLLRLYTSKGGRGAWKIALKIVEMAVK